MNNKRLCDHTLFMSSILVERDVSSMKRTALHEVRPGSTRTRVRPNVRSCPGEGRVVPSGGDASIARAPLQLLLPSLHEAGTVRRRSHSVLGQSVRSSIRNT